MSTISTHKSKYDTTASSAAPKACAATGSKADLIRCRAYELFLARNGASGDHVSDWLQAEQELNSASHDTDVVAHAGERRGKSDRR